MGWKEPKSICFFFIYKTDTVCVCVCTILRQSTANLFLPLQLSLFLRLPRDFETRRFDFTGGVFTLNEHPPFLLKNKVLYSFHSMKSVVSYTEELQWAFTKNKKTWSLIWLSLLKMCWGFYFILLEGTVYCRETDKKKGWGQRQNTKDMRQLKREGTWPQSTDSNCLFPSPQKEEKKNLIHVVYYL